MHTRDLWPHPRQLRDMIRGTESTFVDEYFFDYSA
jgi:hypothetical protein